MITNTQPEEAQEASGEDYGASLRRHRSKRNIRILIVCGCLLIVIGIVLFLHFFRRYDHMEVQWSVTVEDNSYQGAAAFGSGVVKYGRDSASYINSSGETVWIESYEMSHPMAVVRGDYIVLADQGATKLIICSASGKIGEVTTASPITRVAMARQGMIVVILEDERANYLAFYDRTGKKLDIEIRTRFQGDGYPMDLALSPSGEQLMVSYVYVENAVIGNKVVFYNFDVGQDMVDRIMGGFEQYKDTMVPRVAFMDEEHAVAFGDDVITFYSLRNKRKPSITKELPLESQISAVVYNEDYAGVVTETGDGEKPYGLTVYGTDGQVLMTCKIPIAFTKIEFVGNEVLVYNSENMIIYTMSGKIKYQEALREELIQVVPGNKRDSFILISNGLLQWVEIR